MEVQQKRKNCSNIVSTTSSTLVSISQVFMARSVLIACIQTGGPAVAKRILAAAAQYLTPVGLELGGQCPAIVCEDTNISLAAKRIAWAKSFNSGQTCVAPNHVLV